MCAQIRSLQWFSIDITSVNPLSILNGSTPVAIIYSSLRFCPVLFGFNRFKPGFVHCPVQNPTLLMRTPDKTNKFWPSVGVRINEVLLHFVRSKLMYTSLRNFDSSSLNYKDTRIISFATDQNFYEISNLNEKWKWVRCKNGDVGLAPIEYLQQIHSATKKQSIFIIDPEYTKVGQHELNFDEGEQVEVVQGNSQLNLWLVQKLDGRRGLVPSFHLKTPTFFPPVPSRLPSTTISQSNLDQHLDPALPLPSPRTHPLPVNKQDRSDESLTESTSNPLSIQHIPSPQIGSFELLHISDVDPKGSRQSPMLTRGSPNDKSEIELSDNHLPNITPETASQLTEFVRTQAQVSFYSACLSVSAVINFLRENENFTLASSQLSTLQTELDKSLQMEETPIETEDERMIYSLFEIFQERVSNYQERSWEVLSDQHLITTQIDTFIKIFQEGDPRAVRRAISSEDCQLISTLSAFYCGEKSPVIRLKLISALKILLALDTYYCSKLLVTTMASSLTNELLNTRTNFRLGLEAARLGVYLFSSGEQIPIDLYDSWNPDLFSFVFSIMDDKLVLDVDECLSETLMALLLSFNLHVPMNAFPFWNASECGSRNFIDILMLYLNRDIDPVISLVRPRAHSVLKMTENFVSHSVTRDLFDASDLRILIDIGIRNLFDLSHTHSMVSTYLKLLLILYENISCIQNYRVQELATVCDHFMSLHNEDVLGYIGVVEQLKRLF